MLEVSRVGVAESDDEIELSLELSIGGSYGKTEKLKRVEEVSCRENETRGAEIMVPRSGFSFSEALLGDQGEAESGSGSEVVDSQRKKEIQALRRQEARRKREEKLRKSAAKASGVAVNGGTSCFGVANVNDKVCLEAQQLQARARDRDLRENENILEEAARKKEKIAQCLSNEAEKDSNFTLNRGENESESQGSDLKAANISCLQNVPVVQMQGPFSPLQCVPVKNGFVYPYVVPYWGSNVGREANVMKERNMFQPVACGIFKPYLNGNGNGNENLNQNLGTFCDSEEKNGTCSQKSMSNGSLERSSSAISDPRSTSGKGGSSSESGSQSSRLGGNEQQFSVSVTSNSFNQPQNRCSSNKKILGQASGIAANNAMNRGSSTESKYDVVDTTGTTKTDFHPTAASNPASTPEDPRHSKQTNEVQGSSPNLQCRNQDMPSLPQMPCVSTTGDGPNGRTITGFLYRYTKTEVSIVCVCHGNSFSPAEFVEHAGGTDITHPLRHITMIPSSFQ